MQTQPKHIVVVIPNNEKLDVFYYLSDKKIKEEEKETFTDLIIQLQDCHCSYRIQKELSSNKNELEHLVEKTVINAKGHLC